MQFFTLLALITAVAAQTTVTYTPVECADAAAAVPACAKTCIDDAALAEGECVAGDLMCMCMWQEHFQAAASTCVQASCAQADLPNVRPATEAVCACANPTGMKVDAENAADGHTHA